MSGDQQVTCVCLLSAEGRSAVAVVGVSGQGATAAVDRHFVAANSRPLSDQPLLNIVYGHWDGEDLVVCRMADDEVEVHCHGGSQSSVRIVSELEASGCQRIDVPQWVAQHTSSMLHAEAQLALASAPTVRTANYLLTQAEGALQREVDAIRTLLEADELQGAEQRIAVLLERKEFGLHLTRPWNVVIAGEPNVGKSSLINALVGYQRAIVFDQPGTTRDVVSATTALDGWPVELSDTAGLHTTDDVVESMGIEQARQRLTQADLTLWLLDATRLPSASETSLSDCAAQQADSLEIPLDRARTLIVVNKIDLRACTALPQKGCVPVSATTGAGLLELIAATFERLVPCAPNPDAPVSFTDRQVGCLKESLRCCQTSRGGSALASLDALVAG